MKNILFKLVIGIFVIAGTAPAVAKEQALRQIQVNVDVDKKLLPDNPQDWTLYVYAAKPNTRLPLSNATMKLSDVPKTVMLNEHMFLLPHLTLKQADEVIVVARATRQKDPHKRHAEDLIVTSQTFSIKDGDLHQLSVALKRNSDAR